MKNRNLDGYLWCQDKKGYWVRTDKTGGIQKTVYQHIYVYEKLTGCKVFKGQEIHHMDGNPSNNTAGNLVCLTVAQHIYLHQHSKLTKQRKSDSKHIEALRSTNTSGYKGVCFNKARNKYRASIFTDGKQKNLGRFDTSIEAALAYNTAAKIYFGDNCYLNKVENR